MGKKKPGPKRNRKPRKHQRLCIAGLGASAGGLEALRVFLSHIPDDIEYAFIVIQHLDRRRKSMMVELLQKHTALTVMAAENGMTLKPGHVYACPPGVFVAVKGDVLRVTPYPASEKVSFPIDHLFESLAADKGSHAAGIIFSGTGKDGTRGLGAIKTGGGKALVQAPDQARYDGMPRSAIDAVQIDAVLPAEALGAELTALFASEAGRPGSGRPKTEAEFLRLAPHIFGLIKARTGHVFSNYKRNTIQRRIERRLNLHQIVDLAEYIAFLERTPDEIDDLFKELLISVTNFFRDADAFKFLAKEIIPGLLDQINPSRPLRVWVPGCATGEEPYSIGILLAEAMDQISNDIPVQIFASDIDTAAVAFARRGVYPEAIKADMSARRLARFFVKDGPHYKIQRRIREMIVFADQDLIKDPPFSRLHMVSCRNVLIYMDQILQKRIIPLFHYTLQDEGILFLGSSESVSGFADLFTAVNKRCKVFRRRQTTIEKDMIYPRVPLHGVADKPAQGVKSKPMKKSDIRNLAEKVILDKYSMPCVLINEEFDILHFNGQTDRYLTPPVGAPSFNILKMARQDLRQPLSIALRRIIKEKSPITHKGLRVKCENTFLTIDLIVQYLTEPKAPEGLLMVVFDDKAVFAKKGTGGKKGARATDSRRTVEALAQELESTRENLQTSIEEFETSNEELKSTNEELQSTNEELQSTNEELETSKEELQSTNEELITVNAELQGKVDELTEANNDISNLLASTAIGTIFLDRKMKIKRFTPAVTRIFNLIDSDIGRSIDDITSGIKYERLKKDAQKVLKSLENKEIEAASENGQWYSIRIVPYRTLEDLIDGVVIVFVDITELKNTEGALKESEERWRSLTEESPDHVIVLDKSLQIEFINFAAPGLARAELIGMPLYNYVEPGKRAGLKRDLKKVLKTKKPLRYETEYEAPDGTTIFYDSRAVPRILGGKAVGLTVHSRDITDRKQAEQKIESLARFPSENPNPVLRISSKGEILYANDAAQVLLANRNVTTGMTVPDEFKGLIKKVYKDGRHESIEYQSGERTLSYALTPVKDGGYINVYGADISERKQAMAMQTTLLDNMPCIAMILKKETREIVASNKVAHEIGAVPGQTCYGSCAQEGEPCGFCLAPDVWESDEPQRLEVEHKGVHYEGIWVPLSDDLYVHYIFDISERKNAEIELKKSEERFRALSDASFEGVGISEKGHVIEANAAFQKIIGYDIEELRSMDVSDLVAPEDREMVVKHIRSGQTEPYQHKSIRKDGTIIDVEVCGKAITYEGRECRITAIKDITERKRTEIALRESEEKFSKAFHHNPCLMAITTLKEGRIIAANAAFAQSTGYSLDELVGRSTTDLGLWPNPEDRDRLRTLFQKKERVQNLEVPLRCKSGDILMTLFSAEQITVNKGEPCLITLAVDITERNRTAQALRASEERFKTLSDSSPMGIFQTGVKGDVTYLNDTWCVITGMTREDAFGFGWAEALHPDDKPRVLADWAECLAKKTGYAGEFRFVNKEGEVRWVYTRTSPLLSEDGEVIGHVGANEEITERKRTENELKGALQAKEVLLKEVHHRVKNNLQLIVSLIDLQAKHLQQDEAIAILEICTHRIRSISNVYRMLYAQEDLVNINVADHLQEIIREMFGAYTPAPDQVELRIAIGEIDMDIDQAITCSLLMNELISNALQHAFPGERKGRITIALKASDQGELAEIAFADDGIGLAGDCAEGFGFKLIRLLGLQLGLAAKHSSEAGGGLEYIFAPPQKRSLAGPSSGGSIHIVEDDTIIAMARQIKLRNLDFDVDENISFSGEEAIEYIGSLDEEPLLIMMDIKLAGPIDGLEAARQIRADHPDLPIVFCTGYEDETTTAAIARFSHAGVLSKTCTEEEMAALIKRLLAK